jgi:hypothetical protein
MVVSFVVDAEEDKYRGLSTARPTMRLLAASVEMTYFFI